ncbi:carbon-nitrogen hydrolase family protein [Shewanella sp. Scap07]|uniref:carbon-nitrogen hydrolase family protein n=1 Tax=Shewanella sp. Scap07 TaxID=2589987 RepID=UPI0015BFAAFC|nr:carbon-nitrogen hydrolase family protein [Shewanella sp. Scap07]QLE87070.1 carbon-nitrogen hydrolase family protein [Shewanella sp. Scap07]
MKVSLLQCQSSRDVSSNLAFIKSQLELLTVDSRSHLVVLPECALLFGGHERHQLAIAAEHDASELQQALAALAKEFSVTMVAGTIPITADDGRLYSRSYLFGPQGDTLGHYDKMHLFDVDVADGTRQYRESDTFCPGDRISVIDTPFGKVGIAICYDLRFAELFRAMALAGADIIALPAAFTKVTGAAHWQVLLQARAIENQCFIAAAAQWGQHNEGSRETWGQSMLVDPWGTILAEKAQGTGWVSADVDLSANIELKQKMPVQGHNRFVAPQLLDSDANA